MALLFNFWSFNDTSLQLPEASREATQENRGGWFSEKEETE